MAQLMRKEVTPNLLPTLCIPKRLSHQVYWKKNADCSCRIFSEEKDKESVQEAGQEEFNRRDSSERISIKRTRKNKRTRHKYGKQERFPHLCRDFMNNTKESKLLHFLYNPYLTSTTRYLLVLQKICGLVMRNVYCLLASRTSV